MWASISPSFATQMEQSNCNLMNETGQTHKVIPICFAANNSETTAQLFAWLFYERFFKRDTAQWFAFLEKVKPQLVEADYLLYKGLITSMAKNQKAATALLKKSADLGNYQAAYDISNRIVTKSRSEAMRYLKLAAGGGFAAAQFSWGAELLHSGAGPKNIALGIDFIERAAYQNDTGAMAKLLRMEAYLDHDSFIFWQIVERVHVESEGEKFKDYSLNDVKNWPAFCAKLTKANKTLLTVGNPNPLRKARYDTLMEITYRCLTVNTKP